MKYYSTHLIEHAGEGNSNTAEFWKFFEQTQKYSTLEACLEELNQHHWKNGFICLKCGHDKSWQLKHHHLHEYAKCGRQVSPTNETDIEPVRLLLPKRFVAVA